MPARSRARQRAASVEAILDAAAGLFAESGPDGASLRDVARRAGCTHALVTRYFTSKDGLVAAVSQRLATCVSAAVDQAWNHEADPLAALLAAARRDRRSARLVIRCGLGDLQPSGFPACLGVDRLAGGTGERARRDEAGSRRRRQLGAYAAASVVLGWLTFEGFLVAAARLGRVSAADRDRAIAAAADHVLGLARSAEPRPTARRPAAPPPATGPSSEGVTGGRQLLLAAAIALFAERGPASVSVRDVAHRAGVNQGLIYRHFGSKTALLADAIEHGSAGLFPAALAPEGFDIDTVVHQIHRDSPAPKLIARTLVDDIDIATVRTQFPIVRQLLDRYDHVPTGTRPAGASDPRVAVAAAAALALGSAIWGRPLRRSLALPGDGIDGAVADMARLLLAGPVA